MTKIRVRGWSDLEDNILKTLADEGKSASQIATAITSDLGRERSRNSVIGRAHRQGIQLRGTSMDGAKTAAAIKRRAADQERKRAARAAKAEQAKLARENKAANAKREVREPLYKPLPPEEIDESLLIGVHDLRTGLCRFPVKENAQKKWLFCGDHTHNAGVYCQRHFKICYRERKPRK